MEGNHTNFEVKKYDWIFAHVLRADVLFGRNMEAFKKKTWFGIKILRDGEK